MTLLKSYTYVFLVFIYLISVRIVCVCVHVFSLVPECGKMGELNFIHMLTGWIPEVRTIK